MCRSIICVEWGLYLAWIQLWQILIVKNIFVCDKPLEYSGLSLGVNSQTDSFFHGSINDCLCDAALLTTGSFLLCFGLLTIFC